MRFEGRKLKSYAEPVSAVDLKEGGVYFSVQFADEKLLVPIVTPLVFLGKNLVQGDLDRFYFEIYESYLAGIRFPPAQPDEMYSFQSCSPTKMNHIFEFERALDALMQCSLRRKGPHST